ncbi:OmpP1/FadL family transporter [Novispirillum itersonii]|uniref:Long-chain fatty acid transport protein n=1 Tax=Novispirillum itersonii TaxID=189 RepID=A0A7X0DPC8_NOVIT|nr:outer membrane protein transport protein [Novispirillum itersonii]MBB6211127.1 long-chain fatty acid transport protein [Novispirillum itersonii]
MRRFLMGATAVSALALVSGQAFASGFQLKEQAAAGQGRATAGATASAEDLSTIFFNPAGMTNLSGNGFEVNNNYIVPSAKFKNGGSTTYGGGAATGSSGGDAGGGALVPSLYGMYSVNENLKLGIGINAPYGLTTEYDNGWQGRYHALKSELKTLNIQPSVAYRLSNLISVGAGLNFQRAEAELTNAVDHGRIMAALGMPGASPGSQDGVTKLEGDDWGMGFTAGLTIQPTDTTRIGVSYKSRVDHTLDGEITQSNVPTYANAAVAAAFRNTAATADLTTPDVISIGIHQDITPQWSVMADAAWTNWSVFDELRVKRADGGADSVKEENWSDTWFLALGTRYQATKDLDLNFGIAYDQTPVSDTYRTARIPDADRTWLSAGLGYTLLEGVRLNAAYTHIWVADATINDSTRFALNASTDNLRGTYDSAIDIFTLGLTAKF